MASLPALPFAYLASIQGMEMIGFAFWFWMIYHCITREPQSTQKILWLCLIVFVPAVGGLIYFLVRVVRIRG